MKHLLLYLDNETESSQVINYFKSEGEEYTAFYVFDGNYPEGIDRIPTIIGMENGEIKRKIKGYKLGWILRLRKWLNEKMPK